MKSGRPYPRVAHVARLLMAALALIAGLAAAAPLSPARADDLSDALSGLTDDPKAAIQALTHFDDPKAKAALQALSKGLLFQRNADSAIVIGEKDGDMYVVTNAATGQVEDEAKPDELTPIKLDAAAKTLLGGAAGAAAAAETKPLDFAGAVTELNADSFDDKGRAIQVLTAIGDERAIPVLQALSDG